MKLALALFLSFSFLLSFGQEEASRKINFNLKKGLALDGYDPVSYFSGNPKEGMSEFKFQFKGVTYWFASLDNLTKFKTKPDLYEPAYGGWCAFAMGETGEKVKVDPETFKIVGGRLYLFYNFWANNTLTDWNKNEKKLKDQADNNWRKFTK